MEYLIDFGSKNRIVFSLSNFFFKNMHKCQKVVVRNTLTGLLLKKTGNSPKNRSQEKTGELECLPIPSKMHNFMNKSLPKWLEIHSFRGSSELAFSGFQCSTIPNIKLWAIPFVDCASRQWLATVGRVKFQEIFLLSKYYNQWKWYLQTNEMCNI